MAESKEFIQLLDDIRDLHKRKNDGYAGKDAEDPWANFRMAELMGISAFQGCLVRMSDKFIRVCNLSKDPTNEQVGEAITDTLMDLAVYSLIAICLYNEKTPTKDTEDKTFSYKFTAPMDIKHMNLSFKESMDKFYNVKNSSKKFNFLAEHVGSDFTPETLDELISHIENNFTYNDKGETK